MDFDDLDDVEEQTDWIAQARGAGFVPESDPTEISAVWCVSDAHCDHPQNLNFFKLLSTTMHKRDLLILAGDISNQMSTIIGTLSLCKDRFAEVFFVPGNHELWVTTDEGFKDTPQASRPYQDSMGKLQCILDTCERLGVRTRPAVYNSGGEALWVAPVLSWHARSFDTEPAIEDDWDGIGPLEAQVSDFRYAVWSENLDPATDAVADAIDAVNDSWGEQLPPEDLKAWETVHNATQEEREATHTRVVSFSHFVPLLELAPEKRFLFYPNLNKAIGSFALQNRVTSLRPDVHIFGHTHFGWDSMVNSTRFVQAPLAMPKERSSFSTTCIDKFPDFEEALPLLLREGSTWAGAYTAGWSHYYKKYQREPKRTSDIMGRMMKVYKWRGKGQQPGEDECFKGRQPGWELAPECAFCKIGQAPGFLGEKHSMKLDTASKS